MPDRLSAPSPTGVAARHPPTRRPAGLDLPQATVDELALHLDDLYAAARADGASDAEARDARTDRALDESTLDPRWAATRRAIPGVFIRAPGRRGRARR